MGVWRLRPLVRMGSLCAAPVRAASPIVSARASASLIHRDDSRAGRIRGWYTRRGPDARTLIRLPVASDTEHLVSPALELIWHALDRDIAAGRNEIGHARVDERRPRPAQRKQREDADIW